MCFAPQADLIGGIVIGAIGVDAVRHIDRRTDHVALAALPLLLGAHQITEAFVWWGLQGHVPASTGHAALWLYLLIAFVVLPVAVPMAVLALEPSRRRRWLLAPFALLGAVIGALLLQAMLRGPMSAQIAPYHLSYNLELTHGGILVGLYVVAICGALLLSGYRHVRLFGVANLAVVGVLARLSVDGFASLWCAYAAIASGAIALHMRFAKSRSEQQPYALT